MAANIVKMCGVAPVPEDLSEKSEPLAPGKMTPRALQCRSEEATDRRLIVHY